MYVSMYVCMYVCIYVCMYVLLHFGACCQDFSVKVYYGEVWHFCDDPVCPDPVWKPVRVGCIAFCHLTVSSHTS